MDIGLHPAPVSEGVHRELVAALHGAILPPVIMGVTFTAVGFVVATKLDSVATAVVVAIGLVATLVKITAILRFRRVDHTMPAIRSAEALFAGTTFLFAAALGVVGAIGFLEGTAEEQMLLTGLLFGYGAGMVTRVSVRAWISYIALLTATLPFIAAALYEGRSASVLMAGILLMFLIGSLGSVRQSGTTFVRLIVLQQESLLLAHHDPLTGLANRIGLRLAFDRLATDPGAMLAVHCLDLDRFKPVNDRHGHPVGDAVLRMIGERLRDILRPTDLAARTGGDEFVILQYPLHHPEEAEIFARRLVRAIVTPYDIDGRSITIGVSVGYVISPPDLRDLDMLVEDSDIALYRTKAAGGGVSRGSRLDARVAP